MFDMAGPTPSSPGLGLRYGLARVQPVLRDAQLFQEARKLNRDHSPVALRCISLLHTWDAASQVRLSSAQTES